MTKSYFLQLFKYDREKGKLFWAVNTNKNSNLIGKEAGCRSSSGYVLVRVNKKLYRVHRIIWLIEKGVWPKWCIDHINGDSFDNRISNLRDVSSQKNQWNRKSHRNGRLQGTTYNKGLKLWSARITINKKRIFLGWFKTEIEAHNQFLKAGGLVVKGLVNRRAKERELFNDR
jgi:hypothetical protein